MLFIFAQIVPLWSVERNSYLSDYKKEYIYKINKEYESIY